VTAINWLRQVDRRFEHRIDAALWIGLEKTRADRGRLLAEQTAVASGSGDEPMSDRSVAPSSSSIAT